MQQLPCQLHHPRGRVGAAAARSSARTRLYVAAHLRPDGSRLARLGNAPKEALAGVLQQLHSLVPAVHLDPRRWVPDHGEQKTQIASSQVLQQQEREQQQQTQLLMQSVQGAAWTSSSEVYMEAGSVRGRRHVQCQQQQSLLVQLQQSPYMASIPGADDLLWSSGDVDAVALDKEDVGRSQPWQELLSSTQQEWQQQLAAAAPVATVLLAAAALSAPPSLGWPRPNTATSSSSTDWHRVPGPEACNAPTVPSTAPAAFSSHIATLGSTAWPSQLEAATWLLVHCAQQQQQAGLHAATTANSSSSSSSSSSMCILWDGVALMALEHIYTTGCALAALGNSPDLLAAGASSSSSHAGTGCTTGVSGVGSTGGTAAAGLLRVLDYCHLLDTYIAQHEGVLGPGFLNQLEDLSLQAKGHLASGQVTNRQRVFSVLGQQLLTSMVAGPPAATTGPAAVESTPAGNASPISIHINTTSISNPDVSVNPVNTNTIHTQANTSAHLENSNVASSTSSSQLVAPAHNPLSAAVSLVSMVACGAWGGLKLLTAAVRLVKGFLTHVLLLRGLLSVRRAAKAVGSTPSMQS